MATTDSNGLVLVDGSDSMQPLHPVLNSITQSVSAAFNENTRIYPITSLSARTALYNRLGATTAKPLFIWYTIAPTGRNLMYTVGGNATTNWMYYSSSADVAESRTWRVANTAGRTTIFNSVGPGTTANPVMVWRADAPAGQQLEYNVTSSNAAGNWHYVPTSQDVIVTNLTFISGASGVLQATQMGRLISIQGTVSYPAQALNQAFPIATVPEPVPYTGTTVVGSALTTTQNYYLSTKILPSRQVEIVNRQAPSTNGAVVSIQYTI